MELPVGELMVEELNFLDLKILTGMENLVFGVQKKVLNFLEILQHVVSVSREFTYFFSIGLIKLSQTIFCITREKSERPVRFSSRSSSGTIGHSL